MSSREKTFEYAILGAGASGLSLCYYLLEQGVTAPILLIDAKTEFKDDRTWCFWDVEPNPFTHLAEQRWSTWQIISDNGKAERKSTRYPYVHLPSIKFYNHVLDQIRSHKNVTLKLGEPVKSYTERKTEVRIRTSRGKYGAKRLFDARNIFPHRSLLNEAKQTSCWIPQQFTGFVVKTQRPVFDPTVCTLMDFRVNQSQGIHFEYILPFSPTEALVENVYMSADAISFKQHSAEISQYLQDNFNLGPNDYTITHTERGYIPMTDFAFPTRKGERIYFIGTLGGHTRPSSGYTFVRIQRYCRQLVDHLLNRDNPLPQIAPRRLEWLDRVFLHFMNRHPQKCPHIYQRMFSVVPPDVLVRFLSDRSSLIDEALLILALPKVRFFQIALQLVYKRGLSALRTKLGQINYRPRASSSYTP